MVAHRVAAHGDIRSLRRLLWGGVGLLTLFGLIWTDSLEGFAAYALVAAAAVLPSVLWLRAGAPGIPLLPAVAALHYLYFAVSVLRGQEDYESWEILRAAATVALFLGAASLVSRIILRPSFRGSKSAPADFASGAKIRPVIFGGIVVGVLFELVILSGWSSWLGSYLGIVRSVALTAASIAFFLLGYCRAQGVLRGQAWGMSLAGVALMVVLSLMSLYLYQGMAYLLAAVMGYALTSRRVPWTALAPVIPVLFILHAGKAEMRERYWIGDQAVNVSIKEAPIFFSDWFAAGVDALVTGQQQDILNRASLLDLLLLVQRLTPEQIPYLGGQTYALLPNYLVPRFLDPNKTISQAALALLNIRYGVQTEEGVSNTTMGWGVICEAYANFGYGGVLGVGFLFGALATFFTRWSAGASPLAMPTLLALAALACMVNVEADLGYLLVSIWQALVAAAIFFLPLKFLSGNERERPTRRARPISRYPSAFSIRD